MDLTFERENFTTFVATIHLDTFHSSFSFCFPFSSRVWGKPVPVVAR